MLCFILKDFTKIFTVLDVELQMFGAKSSLFDELIRPIITFPYPKKCDALEQSDPHCNEEKKGVPQKRIITEQHQDATIHL